MRLRIVLVVLIVSSASLGVALAADVQVGDLFTPEEIARADDYRGTRYLLGFSSLGLSLLAAGLIGLGFGSRALGVWSTRVTGGLWRRQTALLALIAIAVPIVVTVPLSAAAHGLDRRFGLATNSLGAHLLDVAKAAGFQVVIGLMGVLVFVAVARKLRRSWPAVVAVLGVILTVALVYLFPVVYEPAFNDFDPVRPDVRRRVLLLAGRAGVDVRDVLVADASRRTTRKNAYVSGIGSTKRVVLYDTLLASTPPEQVDVVVAHELAHERNNDVLRGTMVGAGGVILGVVVLAMLLRRGRLLRWLGAEGVGDPRIVPFVVFFVAAASFVSLPVANALSRNVEARADREAIALTGDPGAAVELQVELARDNISDLTPSPVVVWAFFSHPPVLERIEMALEEGERLDR